MKRLIALLLCMMLVAVAVYASADPARFYSDDRNQSYHTEHLRLHIGSKNCKGSGNYLKVRSEAGDKKVVGHLEMADTFTLDEISGNWAKITVTRASKYSTDSHNGMTGWVDADYIECPCSSEEYYANKPRLTYSLAVTTQKTTHLREHPSKTTSSFSQLSKGEQVEIISEYTGKDKKLWYRVRSTKGIMGYIRSDLLEITETELMEDLPDQPEPSSESTSTPYVETPVPVTEVPATEVPITEAPTTPEPVTEAPVTEAPVTPVPATPVPVTEAPITAVPVVESPAPQNVMTIIPDQSLPMPDEVEGDSAGRTTGGGDPGLEDLIVASDGMWDANVNREKYFCFTISCSTGSSSPIELYRWDTETLIGTMMDDGSNGDLTPGDGIYSFGFTAVSSDWGRAQFVAKQDDLWSNDVIIHFYNPDSRDSANYIAILRDAMSSAASQDPSAEGGVIGLVKNQYLLGNVSEYSIQNGVIRYRETHTGFAMESTIESQSPATTAPEITATPEATNTGSSEQVYANWQQAYHDFIFLKRYRSQVVNEDAAGREYADPFGNSYFDEDDILLGLYDLNQDGIPELLITEGYIRDSGLNCAYVYSVRDGRLVYVGAMPNRVFGPCVTGESDYPGLITGYGNNGLTSIDYYTMDSSYNLLGMGVYEEEYVAPNDPEQILDEPIITVLTGDQRLYEVARESRYHDLFQFDLSYIQTEENWEDFLLTATVDWTLVPFSERVSLADIESEWEYSESVEPVQPANLVQPAGDWKLLHLKTSTDKSVIAPIIEVFGITGEQLKNMSPGTIIRRFIFEWNGEPQVHKVVISKPEISNSLAAVLRDRNETHFMFRRYTSAETWENFLFVVPDTLSFEMGITYKSDNKSFYGLNIYLGKMEYSDYWSILSQRTLFAIYAESDPAKTDAGTFLFLSTDEALDGEITDTSFPMNSNAVNQMLSILK